MYIFVDRWRTVIKVKPINSPVLLKAISADSTNYQNPLLSKICISLRVQKLMFYNHNVVLVAY